MIQDHKNRVIYILPNLFTAASCFVGVMSIIASINGNFTKAFIYVFLSLLLDGLDGRVARLTNTTSKFGIEFDSLSDVIAFGAAPAVFFYCVVGSEFGKLGAVVSGFFVVFGAMRLARFNITTGTYEPNIFIGLPIPLAAICLCVWVKFYIDYEFSSSAGIFFVGMILLLSLLMVSNIRYPSFKKIKFKPMHAVKILVICIIFFGILHLYPLEIALILATFYVFYGIFRAIYNLFIAKFFKK